MRPMQTTTFAGKYLTFFLAKEEYGVDVLKVQEIIQLLPITPVPEVPDHIRGYGHVKLGNWVTARAQWHDLLQRWRDGDAAGGGASQGEHRVPVPDSQRGSLRSQEHPVP